jgi:16S rRNA pseudouridine516 synthase
LKLVKILQSQGFGTRKECEIIIKRGSLTVDGVQVRDPKSDCSIDSTFAVDSTPFQYLERVVIALNKPSGYECSHKSSAHRSIFELLPKEFVKRGVEPAGRLDADTTGLIIMSDDGKLLHRLSSPKKNIEKIYLVTLKHSVTEEFVESLRGGVILNDESNKSYCSSLEVVDEYHIKMGIKEGKYHQVKRMVAAASNRVEELSRLQIGDIKLADFAIEEGEYILLDSNMFR